MTTRGARPPIPMQASGERLLNFLIRHLGNEEDLIIPVILDQGERRLFYE